MCESKREVASEAVDPVASSRRRHVHLVQKEVAAGSGLSVGLRNLPRANGRICNLSLKADFESRKRLSRPKTLPALQPLTLGGRLLHALRRAFGR